MITRQRSKPVKTDDGTATLYNDRYGETYHSTFGAHTESNYVFLQSSQVAQRLSLGKSSRVLEIGFGLGLNCLLTVDLALHTSAKLDYVAFEHDLPDAQSFEAMDYGSLLRAPEAVDQLLKAIRNTPDAADIAVQFSSDVHLSVKKQNASQVVLPAAHYHAIYLDAFSPETNPECWTPAFIATLAQSLTADGLLSTYSAKGAVRRAMLCAGLHVEKRPGPPGKREILVARTGYF